MAALFRLAGLPQGPNRVAPPTDTLRRTLWRVEAPTNAFLTTPTAATPVVVHPYRVTLTTRAALTELRTWFAAVQGQYGACWVPSYQADLVPAAGDGPAVLAALAGATTLTLPLGPAGGYTERLFPHEARRHVAAFAADGTVTHLRVTDATADATTETLTLSAPLPAGTVLLSWLRYMRLADDTLELSRVTATVTECTLRFVELPRETPTTTD